MDTLITLQLNGMVAGFWEVLLAGNGFFFWPTFALVFRLGVATLLFPFVILQTDLRLPATDLNPN
jgi:hypothetical protein